MSINISKITTKELLSNAILELLVEYEYEKITITDLCEKAGVVRKTFYNNFSSKDEIIYYAIDKIFLEFEQKTDLENLGVISVFKEIFSFVLAYKENMAVFYSRGLFRFVWESIIKNVTKEHIISKIDKETFLPGDYKYIVAHLASTLTTVLETWINNDFRESADHLAHLTEFLLNKPKVIES